MIIGFILHNPGYLTEFTSCFSNLLSEESVLQDTNARNQPSVGSMFLLLNRMLLST